MKHSKIHAFTLVELITSVIIITILSTVAFVGYIWYASNTRDSVRLADLWNIEKWFEMMRINLVEFPKPENSLEITSSGTLIQYQWDLSRSILDGYLNMFEWGMDPKNNQPYTYVLNADMDRYQILMFLENEQVFSNNITTNTFANNTKRFPQTWGDILGVLLDETTLEPVHTVVAQPQLDISTTTSNFWVIMNDEVETWDTKVLAKVVNLNQYGFYNSCAQLLENNSKLLNKNGIYTLVDKQDTLYDVHCDMTTDGGGWTSVMSFVNASHFTTKGIAPSTMFWEAATTSEQQAQFLAEMDKIYREKFEIDTIWDSSTLFTSDSVLPSYKLLWWKEIMFSDGSQYLTYDFEHTSLADYYIWVEYPFDNQVLPVKKTNISTDVNDRWDLSVQMLGEDGDSPLYGLYHGGMVWPYFNANNNGTVAFDDGWYSVFHKKLWWKLNTTSAYVVWYTR